MKTWSEPLTRTSVTPGSFRSGSSGPAPNCAAATTPRYRVPLSRSQRDLRLAWLWPRQLVNTAGRDPLDRVEVCPSVRGEGRLVDRSIKVQALGRGARVQSFAETAQSPWTDSAFAHWWAAKWIASPSDFASTVSCCWWMPDIACAVGGTAVITVRPWSPSRIASPPLQIVAVLSSVFMGLRSGAGFSPLGRPIRDHLQLITLLLQRIQAAPSDGAESMIEASVSANGATPVTPNSSRPRNHPPQRRSARNSARRYWSSQSRSATARAPRSSSRIRSRNRYG